MRNRGDDWGWLLVVAAIGTAVLLLLAVAGAGQSAKAAELGPEHAVLECWGMERTLIEHAVVASEFWGLPRYLLAAMAEQESSWNPQAVNGHGTYPARGLMQVVLHYHPLFPGDLFDSCDSLNYAGYYVQELIGTNDPRYPEGLPNALARYSGGAEGYADRVLATMGRMQRTGPSPIAVG